MISKQFLLVCTELSGMKHIFKKNFHSLVLYESSERPSAFIMFPHTYFLLQETVEETVPVSGSSAGVNALGLVVFSMCFGLVIGNMKQQGQALRDFFDCLNEAIMRLVAIIIWSVKTHL